MNRIDPPVQDMDCPSHLVLGPDYDINATFECTAPGTTTLWRVDNYLLIDRDQFTRRGLFVLDPRQGESKLVFEAPNDDSKGGFPFVFEALERCYFTLCCLATEDSVNVHTCKETYSSQTVASCYCSELLFMYIQVKAVDNFICLGVLRQCFASVHKNAAAFTLCNTL